MHPWHDLYVDDTVVDKAFPVIVEIPNGRTERADKETVSSLDRAYSAVHYPATTASFPHVL